MRKLEQKINNSNKQYSDFLGNQTLEDFIFSKVTPELLTDIAGKLKGKSSSGADNISSKLLKKILPIIIIPLCHLFNLSLQTGYIPDQLKIAKVIPVYKSSDKHMFTNYRPISLLSSFSKLLEKLVARQMFAFLNKYKLLYNHQYGFRNSHSTSHPIIHFLDKIFQALN